MRKLFSKFKKPSGGDLSSPHSVGSGSIESGEETGSAEGEDRYARLARKVKK